MATFGTLSDRLADTFKNLREENGDLFDVTGARRKVEEENI